LQRACPAGGGGAARTEIRIKKRAWILALMLSLPLAATAGEVARAQLLIEQGDRLWAESRIDDARGKFEQAVADAPQSAEARMKLAGLQLASGHYAEAKQGYQTAISLSGRNAKAWIGLGLAYLHAGDKELARAAFDEAIQIEPARRAQLAALITDKAAKPAK
jgi:cytochrome c-type biogenesis protein CcmH/NrfG